MKKFICADVLAAAMLLPAGTMSFARTGDVVGHIYSTDIRAYIDDIEVSSYNIGGKTVIILEDVLKYKAYDDYSRTLTITEIGGGNVISGRAERYSTSGIEIGNIYETDIKTYICGKQVTAYNIGGKTAVALEDLGGYNSYSDIGRYVWNESTRTIMFDTHIPIVDDYGKDFDWKTIDWDAIRENDDSSWYDDDDDDDIDINYLTKYYWYSDGNFILYRFNTDGTCDRYAYNGWEYIQEYDVNDGNWIQSNSCTYDLYNGILKLYDEWGTTEWIYADKTDSDILDFLDDGEKVFWSGVDFECIENTYYIVPKG